MVLSRSGVWLPVSELVGKERQDVITVGSGCDSRQPQPIVSEGTGSAPCPPLHPVNPLSSCRVHKSAEPGA